MRMLHKDRGYAVVLPQAEQVNSSNLPVDHSRMRRLPTWRLPCCLFGRVNRLSTVSSLPTKFDPDKLRETVDYFDMGTIAQGV